MKEPNWEEITKDPEVIHPIKEIEFLKNTILMNLIQNGIIQLITG